MEDRLAEALNTVIENTSDGKVINILQAVLALDEDIHAVDYTDWEAYRDSDNFVGDMLAWFE